MRNQGRFTHYSSDKNHLQEALENIDSVIHTTVILNTQGKRKLETIRKKITTFIEQMDSEI